MSSSKPKKVKKLIGNIAQNAKEEFSEILRSRRFWIVNLALIVSSVGNAYVVNAIVLKLKLVSAGITGISVVIYYFLGIGNISIIYTLLNIPIFILGWHYVSLRFMIVSLLGSIYFAVCLQLTQHWTMPSSLAGEPLLLAILGGSIAGICTGLYLRWGGSVGGADILAIVIKKKLGLQISITFNTINAIILIFNFIIQDAMLTLLSAIYMFTVTSLAVKTQTGFTQRFAILIISEKYKEIAQQLNDKLLRSSTFIKGIGSFSHKDALMVYTIINNIELGRLKEIVYETDSKGLITVFAAAEVVGQRFISWEDEGYRTKKTAAVKEL